MNNIFATQVLLKVFRIYEIKVKNQTFRIKTDKYLNISTCFFTCFNKFGTSFFIIPFQHFSDNIFIKSNSVFVIIINPVYQFPEFHFIFIMEYTEQILFIPLKATKFDYT